MPMTDETRVFWLGFIAGFIVAVEGALFAFWGLYA